MKKLRSSAYSNQENGIFTTHIHGTWGPPFRPSLYILSELEVSLWMMPDTGRKYNQKADVSCLSVVAGSSFSGHRAAMPSGFDCLFVSLPPSLSLALYSAVEMKKVI